VWKFLCGLFAGFSIEHAVMAVYMARDTGMLTHFGSAADLEVAMEMGKYVNSFRWFGDRYRRPV